MSKNSPYLLLPLTKEQTEFIIRNCDANIGFALSQLQNLDNIELCHKLVDQMEKFKELKGLVEKEKKEADNGRA